MVTPRIGTGDTGSNPVLTTTAGEDILFSEIEGLHRSRKKGWRRWC